MHPHCYRREVATSSHPKPEACCDFSYFSLLLLSLLCSQGWFQNTCLFRLVTLLAQHLSTATTHCSGSVAESLCTSTPNWISETEFWVKQEKGAFIVLPGRGCHRELMPSRRWPDLEGRSEQFCSHGSRSRAWSDPGLSSDWLVVRWSGASIINLLVQTSLGPVYCCRSFHLVYVESGENVYFHKNNLGMWLKPFCISFFQGTESSVILRGKFMV